MLKNFSPGKMFTIINSSPSGLTIGVAIGIGFYWKSLFGKSPPYKWKEPHILRMLLLPLSGMFQTNSSSTTITFNYLLLENTKQQNLIFEQNSYVIISIFLYLFQITYFFLLNTKCPDTDVSKKEKNHSWFWST